MEQKNAENKLTIEEMNKKIIKLEKMLNDNKEQMGELQRESINMFNNKLNDNKEYRENKFNELINDESNSKNDLELQINELNKKEQNKMEYIENKLNEFKKEQIEMNNKNTKEIEYLNQRLDEQINELGNIKKSIQGNNTNDPLIEKKIKDIEKKINLLNETVEKLNSIMEQSFVDVNQRFEEIMNWISNFQNNSNDKLGQLEKYMEDRLENLKKSEISNINFKGEKKYCNKSSINYNDITE